MLEALPHVISCDDSASVKVSNYGKYNTKDTAMGIMGVKSAIGLDKIRNKRGLDSIMDITHICFLKLIHICACFDWKPKLCILIS